jgi:hypothetical protein
MSDICVQYVYLHVSMYVRTYVCLCVLRSYACGLCDWVFRILIFWASFPSFFVCTYVFVKWMLVCLLGIWMFGF